MVESFGFEGGRVVPRAEGASVFVYTAPTDAERVDLVGRLGLDEHDVRSSLDPDELGRLEIAGSEATVILKVPRNFTSEEQLLFTVTSLGIFVSPRRLVVVTTDRLDLFDDRNVKRVANVRDALLKILYGIIAHFLGHLKVINMLSESLEKRVNASMGNRYLLDMFTLEKSLVYFVNGIGSNQVVLEKMLAAARRLKMDKAQSQTLDDIVIENQQCSKQAEIYSNILTGLMDARGSVVNNNLSVLMKRLTVISVIFMPMNVLAGMGGMSEFSAWTRHVPWWIAYSIFLLFLCLVGLATYWVLRKTGLDRSEAEELARRARRRAGGKGAAIG
jgi:magnesium transporter